MKITSIERLTEFGRGHPDVRRALAAWLKTTTAVHWRSLTNVHQTYPHADGVKVPSGRIVTIFNVGGNKCRLLTTINYEVGAVNVLQVLTHAEYDKQMWKERL